MYDLKTIQGKASVGNRLWESIGQTYHVLLNMNTRYNGGRLAAEIRTYFEASPQACEVLIFIGKQILNLLAKHHNEAIAKDEQTISLCHCIF